MTHSDEYLLECKGDPDPFVRRLELLLAKKRLAPQRKLRLLPRVGLVTAAAVLVTTTATFHAMSPSRTNVSTPTRPEAAHDGPGGAHELCDVHHDEPGVRAGQAEQQDVAAPAREALSAP